MTWWAWVLLVWSWSALIVAGFLLIPTWSEDDDDRRAIEEWKRANKALNNGPRSLP